MARRPQYEDLYEAFNLPLAKENEEEIAKHANLSDMDSAADTISSGLLQSLTECFFIILLGYGAARTNFLPSSKQFEKFILNFLLPAVFFKGIAVIDFSEIKWSIVLVLVAVRFLFYPIFAISSCFYQPKKLSVGIVALSGLFMTFSNDIALALPIIESIFGTTHPHYIQFIFVIVMFNCLLFLPPSLFAMEYAAAPSQSSKALIKSVLFNLSVNPQLLFAILGLLCNIINQHTMPAYIEGISNLLAEAYGATALFVIGMNIHDVSKEHRIISQKNIAVICTLLTLKSLIFPFLFSLFSSLALPEEKTVVMFTLLYATIPVAPTLCIWSLQYDILPHIFLPAVVLSTLLSGPLILLTVKLSLFNLVSYSLYADFFTRTVQLFCGVSCFASTWVFLIFILSPTSAVQRLMQCLTATMALMHFGGWWLTIATETSFLRYLFFIFFFTGRIASIVITSWLAIKMLSDRLALQYQLTYFIPFFYLSVIFLPLFSTGVTLIADDNSKLSPKELNPLHLCGISQSVFEMIFSLIGLTSVIAVSLFYYWHRDRTKRSIDAISLLREEPTTSAAADAAMRNSEILEGTAVVDGDDDEEEEEVYYAATPPFSEMMPLYAIFFVVFFADCLFTFTQSLFFLISAHIPVQFNFFVVCLGCSSGFTLFLLFGFNFDVIIEMLKMQYQSLQCRCCVKPRKAV